MSMRNQDGNSSEALHSHMYNFFKHVELSNPFGSFRKDLHPLNANFSSAMRMHTPDGSSSKASQYDMYNFFKHVKLPNPCRIFLNDLHPRKLNSSNATSVHFGWNFFQGLAISSL